MICLRIRLGMPKKLAIIEVPSPPEPKPRICSFLVYFCPFVRASAGPAVDLSEMVSNLHEDSATPLEPATDYMQLSAASNNTHEI